MDQEGFINYVFSSSSDFEWKSAETRKCELIDNVSTRSSYDTFGKVQVVVHLSDKVSYDMMRTHLHFVYTGELPSSVNSSIEVFIQLHSILLCQCVYNLFNETNLTGLERNGWNLWNSRTNRVPWRLETTRCKTDDWFKEILQRSKLYSTLNFLLSGL